MSGDETVRKQSLSDFSLHLTKLAAEGSSMNHDTFQSLDFDPNNTELMRIWKKATLDALATGQESGIFTSDLRSRVATLKSMDIVAFQGKMRRLSETIQSNLPSIKWAGVFLECVASQYELSSGLDLASEVVALDKQNCLTHTPSSVASICQDKRISIYNDRQGTDVTRETWTRHTLNPLAMMLANGQAIHDTVIEGISTGMLNSSLGEGNCHKESLDNHIKTWTDLINECRDIVRAEGIAPDQVDTVVGDLIAIGLVPIGSEHIGSDSRD